MSGCCSNDHKAPPDQPSRLGDLMPPSSTAIVAEQQERLSQQPPLYLGLKTNKESNINFLKRPARFDWSSDSSDAGVADVRPHTDHKPKTKSKLTQTIKQVTIQASLPTVIPSTPNQTSTEDNQSQKLSEGKLKLVRLEAESLRRLEQVSK